MQPARKPEAAPQSKLVYGFGGGVAEGRANMKELLGSKGANLAEMCALGLPVPPGFTITTEVCRYFYTHDGAYPASLEDEVEAALAKLEAETGCRLGDPARPLLLSVRSGARASMPGMMDTVLNLGLNPETMAGLARQSGDALFVADSYQRFIQMYADVVLGVDRYHLERLLEDYKRGHRLMADTELTATDWQAVCDLYLARIKKESAAPFPLEARAQLWGAIGAVFRSWMTHRAVTYRRLHEIPEEWGTAVNVQAMVFGNLGPDSATGVAFTRNPATGENAFFGEYLPQAQGEEVVAGLRTPLHLSAAARQAAGDTQPSLEEAMPEIYRQLLEVRGTLEAHYRDMQDVEFTVQQGRLYMLQTRTGKRSAQAAVRIAVEMVKEGLIDQRTALQRVNPLSLEQLLHPRLNPEATRQVIGKGLPASPGAASGKIVFDAETAEQWAGRGEKVILCRLETSPEDIHGMHAAVGVLTTRGGMTSHAAVVARGMGRACVAGAGTLVLDPKSRTLTAGKLVLQEGDLLTLDGGTGEVMAGSVAVIPPTLSADFDELMGWADAVRQLGVRANAETPRDAEVARRFGAEGIGLCRTEHMFFEAGRIPVMREMILAADEDGRRKALAKLEPMQAADFAALFRIMAGLPVTIRLLDPPLHEFLPQTEREIMDLARESGLSEQQIRGRVAQLVETNPMLGHRGCRLGISFPEIYEMQVRAAFRAARETDFRGALEIMLPLIAFRSEFALLRALVARVAAEFSPAPEYRLGLMIELPRAALRAGELAEDAAFFSFGTNDLTQTALGISRDDGAKFMPDYLGHKLLAHDPFVTLDTVGVGELVRMGVERGRAVRPALKVGVCGEHGGDPASIAFFAEVGLDYVSCSPYRVPVARLAAAQVALKD